MAIRSVKGTRDFYPDLMRLRNWITDAWRRVSLRNGFEEYDAPIFEHLELFTIKSGEEIAEQLFRFTDRGGRDLAIRPEITPSLARMVNAKINALPRPIKWFSMPRLCRAENPQKGRLREFFQWNVDVIGSEGVIADAECIFVAVDLLAELGLAPSDAQVRIGHRQLTVEALKSFGVAEDRVDAVLPVLDKRPKVSDEAFEDLCAKAGLDGEQVQKIRDFQDVASLDELAALLGEPPDVAEPLAGLRRLMELLDAMGAAAYCRLDMKIVRGLAYYTGVVYEVFDAGESLRAVAGGGRYDNLLSVLGGPDVPATGFGMGDVVLALLLEEKGKIPEGVRSAPLEFFVIPASPAQADAAVALAGRLRRAGRSADFSYKSQSIGKQFKEAARRGAAFAVVLEADGASPSVKDMTAGEQVRLGEAGGTESAGLGEACSAVAAVLDAI